MKKYLLILFFIISKLLFLCQSSLGNISCESIFTQINSVSGLSDNQIRNITQLKDGRMIVTTLGSVNIYDGITFKYIHRNDGTIFELDRNIDV